MIPTTAPDGRGNMSTRLTQIEATSVHIGVAIRVRSLDVRDAGDLVRGAGRGAARVVERAAGAGGYDGPARKQGARQGSTHRGLRGGDPGALRGPHLGAPGVAARACKLVKMEVADALAVAAPIQVERAGASG